MAHDTKKYMKRIIMKLRGEYILEILLLLTLYTVIILRISKMLEKITEQHGKEFPGLYTTRTYITVFPSVLHHHLSSPNNIAYLSFRHHLWVCGGLSTTRVTCPARLNINQTNTLMVFDQEYIYETPYCAMPPRSDLGGTVGLTYVT